MYRIRQQCERCEKWTEDSHLADMGIMEDAIKLARTIAAGKRTQVVNEKGTVVFDSQNDT